ncbi:MAG: tyrosine-type recombinase/integrase, partial [Synergistaceae bacterium]|nr:tyrosine-type recombinase/integrase [Synergistaceae bacterium]
PRNMRNRFQRILKAAGLEKKGLHVLRHTFATKCVELGFDIKSLSEILGHANVNITLNRYVHPSMKLKHANMNKLNSFICSQNSGRENAE